jgi:hypothetical protein
LESLSYTANTIDFFSNAGTCQNGYSSYSGSCFKVVAGKKKYFEASSICKGDGGLLAKLDTDGKNNDIVR